jgi:hypothetical protein
LASKGPYAIYCFLHNKSELVNDKEIERYVDIKGSKAHFQPTSKWELTPIWCS